MTSENAPVVFCPTAGSAPDGFVISHLPHGLVEVRFLNETLTQVVRRRRSGHIHEEVLYLGLLTLQSGSSGEPGITYKPLSDLTSMFPLTVGDSHELSMEVAFAGRVQRIETSAISVRSKKQLKIGLCRYDVFTIAVTFDPPGQASVFYDYSPELRCILNTAVGGRSLNKGVIRPLSELPALISAMAE
ncbi:hypothetical protein ACG04Q_15590 [Roseateles sp. DXS20W]|uniref:Uncharacterized protein n=1 Tax=Pelomonas lactea TaxID=3299030 RepID=A0ABW7GM09_9BURK